MSKEFSLSEQAKAYQKWWDDEGSAMRPLPNEDQEEHVRRISEIAWMNGAFLSKQKP